MPLAVSTARVEITPQLGQPIAGYGTWDGPREATGTASPLWARAVCLWDDGYPNVIVSVGILGVGARSQRRGTGGAWR